MKFWMYIALIAILIAFGVLGTCLGWFANFLEWLANIFKAIKI